MALVWIDYWTQVRAEVSPYFPPYVASFALVRRRSYLVAGVLVPL